MSVERRRRPMVVAEPVAPAPREPLPAALPAATAGTVAGTTRRAMPDGRLCSTCASCGHVDYAPDKGLGRARLGAWESRHGVNCAGPGHRGPNAPTRVVVTRTAWPTLESAMRRAGLGQGPA